MTNLDDKKKEDIALTLQQISAKERSIKATKQETDAIAQQLGGSKGISSGMAIGSSIAIGIFSAITSYSSSKQAKDAGEAISSGLMNGATSALSGAGAGAMIGSIFPGIGTGIGALIGGLGGALTSGLSSIIGYNIGETERLINKANELTEAWKQQRSVIQSNGETIESISSEYEKLSKGVSNQNKNISLSTEEYKRYNEIVNQIAEMFPTMVSGYTDEGNAILAHKGNVEKLTEAYEEQKRVAQEVILDGASDIWKGFKSFTGSVYGSPQKETDLLKQLKDNIANQEALKPLLQEVWDYIEYGQPSAEFNKLYSSLGVESLSGITDDNIKQLQSKGTLIASTYNQIISQANTETEKVKPIMSAFLETNFDFQKLNDQVQDSIKTLLGGFDYSFFSQFNTADEMYDWIKNNLILPISDPETSNQMQDALKTLLNPDLKELSADEYAKTIKNALSSLPQELQDKLSEEIRIKLGIDIDLNDLKSNLKENAKGIISDDLIEDLSNKLSYVDLQTLASKFSDLKITATDDLSSIIEKIELFNKMSNTLSIPDLSKSLSETAEKTRKLQDIQDEWNETGRLSLETYEELVKNNSELLKYITFTADGIYIQTDELEKDKLAKIDNAKATIILSAQERLLALETYYTSKECVDAEGNFIAYSKKLLTNAQSALTSTEAQRLLGDEIARVNGLLGSQDKDRQADYEKNRDKIISDMDEQLTMVDQMGKSINKTETDRIKKSEEAAKKISDINKKLNELNKKDKLDNLKNSIESVKICIDSITKAMESLDLKMDLTWEDDYATKSDILSKKLDLVILKSSAMKAEFERLSKITPTTAAQAEALKSRLETLGNEIRSNMKDFVSLNKSLQTLRLDVITNSVEDTRKQLDRELGLIEYNIKALTEGSLFGNKYTFGLDFLIPDIPKSSLEKQRSENEKMVAEEQRYQNEILKISQTALKLQDAENKKASAESRAQLLSDLQEAKGAIQKTSAEVTQKIKDSNTQVQIDVNNTANTVKDTINGLELKIPEIDTTAFDVLVTKAKQAAIELNETLSSASGQTSSSGFINPTSKGRITSGFGKRSSPTKGASTNHKAIDIGAASGTPIHAVKAGTVLFSGWAGGYGNSITIDHGDGYKTQYSHMLNASSLKAGTKVTQGQVIGKVGSTGTSTGNHLDFKVFYNGKEVNPSKYIPGYVDGGITKERTILAGEKGREIAELPNGKVMLLGENGAELYHLPISTKIVNNKETEEILKYTGTKIDGQQIPKFKDGNTSLSLTANSLKSEDIEKLRVSIDELSTVATMYSKGFMNAYVAFNTERTAELKEINKLKSTGKYSSDLLDKVNNRLEKDLTFAYNLQIQAYESKAGTLSNNYAKLLAEYKKIEKTASPDVLVLYQEGLQKIQDEIGRIDEGWRNATEAMREYYLSLEQEKFRPNQEKMSGIDKEIDALEKQAAMFREYFGDTYEGSREQIDISNSIIDLLNRKIAENKSVADKALANEDEIRKKYSGTLKNFDTELWFDAYGQATKRFNDDLNLMNSEQRKTAELFQKLIQENREHGIEANDAILDAQKEIYSRQNQINEIIKSQYEKTLSFINKTIDSKIKGLEEEKKALQKKNDETDRAIELEKLQNNLANARQKTMRVYYEDRGWIWEEDKTAVEDAQKALDDFNNEEAIRKIDDQIDSWEKYREAWGGAAEQYETEQEKLIAQQILGKNIESDILNQRTDKINKFKNDYISALKAISEQLTTLPTIPETSQKTPQATSPKVPETPTKMPQLILPTIPETSQKTSQKQTSTPKTQTITIKSGDNLTSLAKRYKTTVDELMKLNPSITNKNKIYAGNKLIVPKLASGTTYVPVSGLYNVDELGEELIIRKPDSGRYTYLEKGDGVLPNDVTKNLLEVASAYNPFAESFDRLSQFFKPQNINNVSHKETVIHNHIDNISLPNVTNGNDFVKELKLLTQNH